MPYTRAYQLPAITAEKATQLNITSSSNWIQETFYAKDITTVEVKVETGEGPHQVKLFPISKEKRSSLYQKFSDMQTRAEIFRVTIVASNPVPNTDTVKMFIEHAGGDTAELDNIKKSWEMETISVFTDTDFNELIDSSTEETVYLRAESFANAGLESIRLTISSPDMPTRGDTQVTAILYSPIDGGIKGETGQIDTAVGDGIPFSWTDKSGFRSTLVIFPHVIYEIQPVSIELGYELTLLA